MAFFALAVLRHKFNVTANEMGIALLKSTSFSIVKERMDALSALFTTGGEPLTQVASIPMHLGV